MKKESGRGPDVSAYETRIDLGLQCFVAYRACQICFFSLLQPSTLQEASKQSSVSGISPINCFGVLYELILAEEADKICNSLVTKFGGKFGLKYHCQSFFKEHEVPLYFRPI